MVAQLAKGVTLTSVACGLSTCESSNSIHLQSILSSIMCSLAGGRGRGTPQINGVRLGSKLTALLSLVGITTHNASFASFYISIDENTDFYLFFFVLVKYGHIVLE